MACGYSDNAARLLVAVETRCGRAKDGRDKNSAAEQHKQVDVKLQVSLKTATHTHRLLTSGARWHGNCTCACACDVKCLVVSVNVRQS